MTNPLPGWEPISVRTATPYTQRNEQCDSTQPTQPSPTSRTLPLMLSKEKPLTCTVLHQASYRLSSSVVALLALHRVASASPIRQTWLTVGVSHDITRTNVLGRSFLNLHTQPHYLHASTTSNLSHFATQRRECVCDGFHSIGFPSLSLGFGTLTVATKPPLTALLPDTF